MQMLAASEQRRHSEQQPPQSPLRASAGQQDDAAAAAAAAAAGGEGSDDRFSASLTPLVIADVRPVSDDSHVKLAGAASEAAVFTLSVRAACIEGE